MTSIRLEDVACGRLFVLRDLSVGKCHMSMVVTFRNVPEAITQGREEKDAARQAADCLEEAIGGKKSIPAPASQSSALAPL